MEASKVTYKFVTQEEVDKILAPLEEHENEHCSGTCGHKMAEFWKPEQYDYLPELCIRLLAERDATIAAYAAHLSMSHFPNEEAPRLLDVATQEAARILEGK